MSGVSNGLLRRMAPEARQDHIAVMAPDARRVLAHIAVLGAHRHIEKAQDPGISGSHLDHRLSEALGLLAVAADLTEEVSR